MRLSNDLLFKMYRMMFLIRCFEEKAIELTTTGAFPGKLHSSLGQEAMAAGACLALRKGDYIVSTHRPIGHLLAMGADPGKLFAEFMGKATGYSGGKGGMMHIADPDLGILGSQGIVGSGIPIAAGAGLALKLRRKSDVVLCFLGDGAANTGAFHEGINLAALWKAPVVFFCENNGYALSTKTGEACPVGRISSRASAYGIPGAAFDGNDVEAVYHAVGLAVEQARGGKGPSLIEGLSYRIRGHYEGDPLTYRTRAELEEALAKEPVRRFRDRLLKENMLTPSAVEALESEVRSAIAEAVQSALASPMPDPACIYEDVYA